MTTKKLAKELGLLRQRSQSSKSKKALVSNQLFSYLIVIDFESTCWREKNNHSQEIIEFPAVLLNTSTGDIESEFHTYVQPQEHPVLSEFCTELTGITQTQVEAGVPLQICLSQFSRWLQNLQLKKGVVFPSNQTRHSEPLPPQKLCAFLTWSDWDLGVCLQYECKRKQLHKPDVLNSWIDLRSTYRLFYSRKPKGLNGALQDLGIQFSGREHSGLDDSRNTAQLAARMMRDGCIMRITRSLDRNPRVGKPKFGRTSRPLDNKENHTNKKQDASTTSRSSSSKPPHSTSQTQPCSENNSKDLDVKKNLVSARPSPPAYQSLISPKMLLGGWTGRRWGQSRTSAASAAGSTTPHAFMISSASTSSHNNNSLVLCSTTVSCFSNPPQRNRTAETGLTSGPMEEEEGAEFLVETEERCGSYDDVVLGEIDCRMSDFDSGCYECVETDDLQSPVHQDKAKENLTETVTRDSFAGCGSAKNINHLNAVMQRAHTSAVPRRNTELPLKETCSGPRKSFRTSSSSFIRPKPFVLEKTSTPRASFTRPDLVSTHKNTLKSPFTVYTEQTKQAAAPPRGSLHTPVSVLSSLPPNTHTRNTHSSSGPAARGVQRVTAPLCECGRRAKRQLVSNGGPNHGRGFYCCPVRRSGGGRAEKGCQFFKWESAVARSSSAGAPPPRSSVSLCQINSALSLRRTHRPARKSC
ncbi:ERI1 exoribonuclease 2 [Salarias fasciatus]|uniref:ERI1 exoribonuclease 2 n=1 Tax=Salarias fasciatus TaxID=181472 RepID=UPI001176BFE3|nr:ERI1 exoribonuclease 2 [Salarias fasciatus]